MTYHYGYIFGRKNSGATALFDGGTFNKNPKFKKKFHFFLLLCLKFWKIVIKCTFWNWGVRLFDVVRQFNFLKSLGGTVFPYGMAIKYCRVWLQKELTNDKMFNPITKLQIGAKFKKVIQWHQVSSLESLTGGVAYFSILKPSRDMHFLIKIMLYCSAFF